MVGNGEKKLLMAEIASVASRGELIIIKSIFGEEKEFAASIKEIDFMTNSIVLEKRPSK